MARPCLKTSISLHSTHSHILPLPVVSITREYVSSVSFRLASLRCMSAVNKHFYADNHASEWDGHMLRTPSAQPAVSVWRTPYSCNVNSKTGWLRCYCSRFASIRIFSSLIVVHSLIKFVCVSFLVPLFVYTHSTSLQCIKIKFSQSIECIKKT